MYFELNKLGISPPVADEMELWECAASLGAHRSTDDEETDEEEQPQMTAREMNMARIRAQREGAPEPRFSPSDASSLKEALT